MHVMQEWLIEPQDGVHIKDQLVCYGIMFRKRDLPKCRKRRGDAVVNAVPKKRKHASWPKAAACV